MIWLLLLLSLFQDAPQGEPAAEESLHYTINWPSGLSLGEADLRSRRSGDRWELEFTLEAAVPGFAVNDHYRSIVREEFCSLELEKRVRHGDRRAHERTSFDAARGLALRQTMGGGGQSEMPVPSCPRDGLAFLHHLRRELGLGRLPPAQEVFFGARYQVSLRYLGVQTVRVNEVPTETERLQVLLKGPASEHAFELFFARDAARTPVMARVSLPTGVFSMELVR